MFIDFTILIFKSLRHRPIRSWLTILGVVIGVMLVVLIFSLSNGIKNAIARTLQTFGNDLVIIFPGKETDIVTGLIAGQRFRADDINALARIPGVDLVLPIDLKAVSVEYRGDKQTALVHSGPLSAMEVIFKESRGVKFDEGGWPETEDSNKAVFGYSAAHDLFKNKVRVGDEVVIQSKRLKVSGIFSRLGSREDDASLYMSWSVLRSITGAAPGVVSAIIKVNPKADMELVADQIKLNLGRQDVISNFSVLTPDKAGRIIDDVLSIVEIALLIIALISVVVGAVGIMNTMYTAVLERIKQIGILKSVGASREHIMALFLIESGLIGFIGGFFGIILGFIAAYLISIVAGNFGLYSLFSFGSIDYLGFFIILILTFVIGIISGTLPARSAAAMEPAEALRYE